MSRTPLAAANWKMHKTTAEAAALVQAIGANAPDPELCEIVICPPYTALHTVVSEARGYGGMRVGAQNCHWEPHGAFTGEVSAPMIAALGCTHVIIGHSERRQYCGETDATVAKRLRAALEHHLTAIVCLGETAAERQANETDAVLQRQLDGGLGGCTATDWASIVIAYEPIWAIGTGQTATPAMANDAHACIRNWIGDAVSGDAAAAMRILYGGSVKPANAADLFAEDHIDGGLIGGASLDADQFLAITGALAGAPTT